MITNLAFELGKKTAKIALKKTVHTTYKKGKKILTSSEGVAGIASGTAAAMTTPSLGLKGTFLGLKRILSCHPIKILGGGEGLDPVKKKRN